MIHSETPRHAELAATSFGDGPRPAIYLCGAIGGRSLRQASQWRQQARELLSPQFDVIDPLRDIEMIRSSAAAGQRLVARETNELFTDSELVERDIRDVQRSYLVLRHYTGPSEGSPMECVYAKFFRIPVVVSGIADPMDASPWLRYHSVRILPTLVEAVDYVKTYWKL